MKVSVTPEVAPTALPRLAVVLSGRGSTFRALHDAVLAGDVPASICGVFSDKVNAYGLEIARERALPAQALSPRDFASREAFDGAFGDLVAARAPDWILLAGYMRILTPGFCERFAGRLLNIHPSLLPLYPGLHTYERALADGCTEHGSTVHFVTAELDGGPRIAQVRVPVVVGDDVDSLSARVQAAERKLYPTVARWAAQGRLAWQAGHPSFDGAPLQEPLAVAAR
jgi:phosphoribosylglycinamide formyltransferase-1